MIIRVFFLAFLVLNLINTAKTQDGGFDNVYVPKNVPNKDEKQPQMSFNYIDSPLEDISWCGEKKNVLFILSERNTLYRSLDDGFSGHKFSEHLEKIGQKELGDSDAFVGQVIRIIKSPIDPSLYLFLGSSGINWVTEDCGNTSRALNHGRKIIDFQFHPTQRDWLLASAWTECDDFEDGICKKYKELYISQNLGKDWKLIADYVFQFAWGKSDSFSFSIPESRIIIAHEPHALGHQKVSGWNERINVAYSDDFFATQKILVKGGNKFLVSPFFLFVVQVNDEDSQEVTLLVGNSRDPKYPDLKPIELPHKHLFEHSYTILDSSEHSVFLQINHEGDRSKFGSVYISDSTGVRYSLSLQGNVRNSEGQADFEKVQGLLGIYLANVYEESTLKKYSTLQDDSGLPSQNLGSKREVPGFDIPSNSFHKGSSTKLLDDSIVTKISFDKGALWQRLTPPLKDVDKKAIVCLEDDCSLHLHSISSTQFGPFYSTENSFGLIIGTGNVGKYLSHRHDEVDTYLSRDGGDSWEMIARGSHIYEIGDHGSILVIAPDQDATTEIKYSWNEGLTWHTLTISEVPIEISNIIIEPTNTEEKFIIYGRVKDMSGKGAIVAIDFFPLHNRFCVNPDLPNSPDSDYETWTPNGKITQDCLLGKKMNYIRKKREAECFNSEEHERFYFVDVCTCTEEDWECDYGYYRKDGIGPCISPTGKEANHSAPEDCAGSYYVTQGYRKVPGDLCQNGVDHSPIEVPCPGLGSLNQKNILIFLAIILILVGLGWISNSKNSDMIKDLFGATVNNVKVMLRMNKKPDLDKEGFQRIDEIPDSLRDDDPEDEFSSKLTFGDNETTDPNAADDVDLLGMERQKRMTERKADEAAQKKVPKISKPQ